MPRGYPKKKWEKMQAAALRKERAEVKRDIARLEVVEEKEDSKPKLATRANFGGSYIVQLGQPWIDGSKTIFVEGSYDPIEQIMKDWKESHPTFRHIQVTKVEVKEVLSRGER